MSLLLGFLLSIAIGCSSLPDHPVKVDLPVYDFHAVEMPNVLMQDLMNPEVHDGDKGDNGNAETIAINYDKIFNNPKFISQQIKDATNVVEGKQGQTQYAEGAFIDETEGLDSKMLSAKENILRIVGIRMPEPIVDNIKEKEKYGNHGEKFSKAGTAIVGAAEKLSKIVNNVLEVPAAIFIKLTRVATERLNTLGGKIVGLY